MVAMLAFGGTYAYFTATAAKQSGEVTTGFVKLSATQPTFTTLMKADVLPGDQLFNDDASVGVTVDTTDDGNYVSVKITAILTKTDDEATEVDLSTLGLTIAPVENDNTAWTYVEDGGYYYFPTAIADGDSLNILDDSFVFPNLEDNWVEGEDDSTNFYMGATVTIEIEARSIQSSNIAEGKVAEEIAKLWA